MACTLPSRWIASIPPASSGAAEKLRAVGAVSVCHAEAAASWPIVAAEAPMLSSAVCTSSPGTGARVAPGGCGILLDDDRGGVDGRVVVAVLDEQRDVEQVLVERARCEVGHRGVGDDVEVAGRFVRADTGAFDGGVDRDGVGAVRQVGDRHTVAGEEGDGVAADGGRIGRG